MIGVEKESNGSFFAETDAEESLMLMGKVNALKGIFDTMPEQINAELIDAMFGFTGANNAELKRVQETSEMYYGWYKEEKDKAVKYLIERDELQAKLDEMKKGEKKDDTV